MCWKNYFSFSSSVIVFTFVLVYVLYVITVFNYDFKHIKVPWTKFCFTLNLFEGLNFVGGFEGLFKITNEHFFHTLFN